MEQRVPGGGAEPPESGPEVKGLKLAWQLQWRPAFITLRLFSSENPGSARALDGAPQSLVPQGQA